MATDPEVRSPTEARRRRGSLLLRRVRRVAAQEPAERTAIAVLGVLGIAITVGHVFSEESLFTLQLLPVYLASRWLGPRPLAWFSVWMVANFLVMLLGQEVDGLAPVLRVLTVILITAFVLRGAVLRERLGVTGRTGEKMLVDLRERILRQSSLPSVPTGWTLDSELRSAGNTPFSGDFVIGHRSGSGRWLDLVVVDVSGKGVGAGSRSLVLNGAMGALLTGLPGPNFLDVVNAYLVQQGWDEGFATAVHAHVDLLEGEYWITSAGHPASVHLPAEPGHWTKLQPPGPVLGLLPGVEYDSLHGRMERGDSLLLYTDGMVEDRSLEIDTGIAELVGAASQTLDEQPEGGEGAAARIMTRLDRARAGDDCAIVVLRRS